MPVVFSKAFYKALAAYAAEFHTTRAQFVIKAVRYYAEQMRKKDSPMGKALPSEDVASAFREAQSTLAKSWWATLTPEEKAERSRKANQGRWPQTQTKPKRKK